MTSLSCSECGKGITRSSKTGRCPSCASIRAHIAARRPMPADFPTVAGKMETRALRNRYGAGRGSVLRWMKEAGLVPPDTRSDAKPMPADFATIAPGKTLKQIGRHYGAHGRSVKRWLSQSGITPATYQQPKRQQVPSRKKSAVVRPINYSGPHQVKVDAARDTSLEGLAAEHLRCATRAIIYRCDDKGRADPKGQLWRYGNVILTPAELFVRAHRHGFEARRFAA
jgi:hypothetical protein